ncbi:hypothetical protein JHK84_029241 [Glycine max]|nr:hypothetical protein JHK84_029241 [Glycine max]
MHDNFSTSKKNLDDAMKHRFKELLVLMNPGLTKESASITLLHVDVPRQQNMWVVCVALMFIYVENSIHFWC